MLYFAGKQMKQFYKLLLEGDVPTMRKLIIALLLVNGIIWFIPEHTPDPAIEVADAELNEETISVRLDTE